MARFSHTPLDFQSMSPQMKFLIIANIIGFALAWIAGGQFYDLFGLVPNHVWHDHWVWQPVTYLFLHANIFHLLFNLFALWMFATPIEAQWGSWEFLKFYFLCGIGAGLLNISLTPHSLMPTIGASGAIYGLLVAFAMLYPDAILYMYLFFPLKAKHFVIICGLIEFLSGMEGTSPGIARYAHLGGMVIAYGYIRWWWVLKVRVKSIWRDFGERQPAPPTRSRVGWVRRVESKEDPVDSSDEVDRILDKISAFGKDSLSERELEILRRVSKKRKPEGNA